MKYLALFALVSFSLPIVAKSLEGLPLSGGTGEVRASAGEMPEKNDAGPAREIHGRR